MSDTLIDQVMQGMPQSWDLDESPESVVLAYVRELERRVVALGGDLERCEGVSDARAAFNATAAAYADTDGDEGWNAMADAWHNYVSIKEVEA